MNYSDAYDSEEGVAIIGVTGRFPGAQNVSEFWRNLTTGRETICHFRDDELESSSPTDMENRSNPDYVRSRGILDNIEMFDASFFGISRTEAEVLDPQHRIFLEMAWEAFEDAGHDPQFFSGPIGVFAGAGENAYYVQNLLNRTDVTDAAGGLTMMTSKHNDYLATRVAYKLNLTGPALDIQTACSTSLVTVCSAVQSLSSYQCDMAIAGGISIALPQRSGHLWQEGMIFSKDGHCRAFDREASGTVFSSAAGIVVLRRLQDAIEDNDRILAVIKGVAINNDGSSKVSYSAPSVDGQAQVIAMAQALGGIDPDTISYVEAHGTGTSLGDPVEIAGLTQAFRAGGAKRNNYCGIGSVKTNIGHADQAAGIVGLIKTILALRNRQLPPSLHFESPNPKLNLDDSPFYVNYELRSWDSGAVPRRAGVSSFGVGGTNAHVVLEEAPAQETEAPVRDYQLIVLSARSTNELDESSLRLRNHLKTDSSDALADIAYTLQTGRRSFDLRRALVCKKHQEAIEQLKETNCSRLITGTANEPPDGVAFLFPGQGAQYVNMGRSLYETEPLFREEVNYCCDRLQELLGLDLRSILYPEKEQVAVARAKLDQTAVTQPALFVIEYSLARLWMSWGVEPTIMIGHSLGEYTAATLGGVFSRDDALALVAKRARMMQDLPTGSMIAVRVPAEEIVDELDEHLSIAALNAPRVTVLSGDNESISHLEARLEARFITCQRLTTSHAFHSSMLDPMIDEFTETVNSVPRQSPTLPWISSLTGAQISESDATDPVYWATQMRQTVRFFEGISDLVDRRLALLEIGPGRTLTSLARQHPDFNPEKLLLTSLQPAEREDSDLESMLTTVGRYWAAGGKVNWSAIDSRSRRRRVSLPTYPFNRSAFWITAPETTNSVTRSAIVSKQTSSAPAALDSPEQAASIEEPEIEAKLLELFSDLSGLNPDAIDTATPFLDLGFDSLFLTQASAAIRKRLGLEVSLFQLTHEWLTIQDIARHLNTKATSSREHDPTSYSAANSATRSSVAARAANPKDQSDILEIEPFYFGPADRESFGIYHPPTARDTRVLTIICPPVFLDYVRTHNILRRVAITLASKGQHVIRFDYRGTGDSYGDLDTVKVSDWIEDVSFAVEEGRALSGCSSADLLGVRAGAVFAAHAAAADRNVGRLVLWDPVLEGSHYLKSLRHIQLTASKLNSFSKRSQRSEMLNDFGLDGIPSHLRRDINALDSSIYSQITNDDLHIITTSSKSLAPIRGSVRTLTDIDCNWNSNSEDIIFPLPVLEALVACLTDK